MSTINGNKNLTFVRPGGTGITVTGDGILVTDFNLHGTKSGLVNRFRACVALWKWLR